MGYASHEVFPRVGGVSPLCTACGFVHTCSSQSSFGGGARGGGGLITPGVAQSFNENLRLGRCHGGWRGGVPHIPLDVQASAALRALHASAGT